MNVRSRGWFTIPGIQLNKPGVYFTGGLVKQLEPGTNFVKFLNNRIYCDVLFKFEFNCTIPFKKLLYLLKSITNPFF